MTTAHAYALLCVYFLLPFPLFSVSLVSPLFILGPTGLNIQLSREAASVLCFLPAATAGACCCRSSSTELSACLHATVCRLLQRTEAGERGKNVGWIRDTLSVHCLYILGCRLRQQHLAAAASCCSSVLLQHNYAMAVSCYNSVLLQRRPSLAAPCCSSILLLQHPAAAGSCCSRYL